MHLNGAASNTDFLNSTHTHPAPQHKPTKLRRFLSIGSRSSKARSPGPTDVAKKPAKRSLSSLHMSRPNAAHESDTATGERKSSVAECRSGSGTGTLELLMPAKEGRELESAEGQCRKDSLVKSFYDGGVLTTRTAALTSHPVGEKDLESVVVRK